jgi:hypothetical protein
MAKNPTPAQIAALKKSKGVKPTAAITKTGQKATGLAKSSTPNRFASTAKTPVRSNISGLSMRGSGTPLGTSMAINPLSKGQIAGAALTVAGGKALPSVIKAASRAAEKTRLAVGTEKMVRQMSRESGIPMPKISSRIKVRASQSKMAPKKKK